MISSADDEVVARAARAHVRCVENAVREPNEVQVFALLLR